MSIIADEYEIIAPQIKYLSDEVILAQAWKKSHSYIRRRNSYADVLELDCSTIDLQNKLSSWAKQLNTESYQADDMRLVLAPKNKRWYFPESTEKAGFNSWISRSNKQKSDEQGLRPLAHMTIKDQTASTAVMLCLADAVETSQGPSDQSDFIVAQSQQIYSYGNRLHCNWEAYPQQRKKASFGWGNSQCYRQYYQDYKTFLLRPRSICQGHASSLAPNRNLYVVSLDLKEFYDKIDVKALIGQLKKIYKEYYVNYKLSSNLNDEEKFWGKLEEIFSWEWDKRDTNYYEIMPQAKPPKGLPQGLVASGFLSNAYLVHFDRKVGEKINHPFTDESVILIDYCRYVDDMRLVIEVSEEVSKDEIEKIATEEINKLLKEYQARLGVKSKMILNSTKTKAIPYRQLSAENNVSSQMNMLQGVLSGTPDAESLRHATGGLDGLLGISEQLDGDEPETINPLDLSRISTPNIDVRDDTLKRFVATRMVKSLRLRRSMTDLSERLGKVDTDLDNVTAGQMLDYEFETTARKLIAAWASNPSLSLLLRCGLDLYPDPMLLVPVIDALKTKLDIHTEDPILLREMKVAEYTCADLLRAATTEIGYSTETVYPDSADLQGFREELVSFARSLLADRPQSPWYIKQQAVLFLISTGDYGFSLKSNNEIELNQYALLQDVALYRTSLKGGLDELLTVSLVIQQISPNPKKYASWFIELMNKQQNPEERKQAIMLVSLNRPDLMNQIIKSNRMRNVDWSNEIPVEIRNSMKPTGTRELTLKTNKKQSLLRIIQSKSNPFKQENALLKLAQAILVSDEAHEYLTNGATVNDISVNCVSWEEIQYPSESGLAVEFGKFTNPDSELRAIPEWILKEYKWMYALGRILRSCITGEYDFTANAFLMREDLGSYKGVRSTWFSRRFGLSNHPRGLLSEPSPISPWLSEFLIRLLQWPGIRQWGEWIKDVEQVRHPGDLLRIIQERLKYQRKIFGHLSKTPTYTLPVPTSSEKKDNKIQVAVVQPLLPKMSDFNVKDPLHWTPSFRAIHRNHIASLCNLVSSQLKATQSAQHRTNFKGMNNTAKDIDLIVFPELTVHPDDIDLLRGLSDATKANIYTGLTFIQPETSNTPINQALWLLRAERPTGREFMYVHQGKKHMTKSEIEMGVEGFRPYQVLVELGNGGQGIRLTGSICYDATDLALVADLREVSDIFIIAAMNQDVQTFDNMVTALHYHMYQPVILANTGEFGGSTAQAPFNRYARQIAHIHGNNQVAVSIFEVDATAFRGTSAPLPIPEVKTPPAGYKGRNFSQ